LSSNSKKYYFVQQWWSLAVQNAPELRVEMASNEAAEDLTKWMEEIGWKMPQVPANFPSSFGANSLNQNVIWANFYLFVFYLLLLATFIEASTTTTNNPSANEWKGWGRRRRGYCRTLREEGNWGRNDGFVEEKITRIGGKWWGNNWQKHWIGGCWWCWRNLKGAFLHFLKNFLKFLKFMNKFKFWGFEEKKGIEAGGKWVSDCPLANLFALYEWQNPRKLKRPFWKFSLLISFESFSPFLMNWWAPQIILKIWRNKEKTILMNK